MKKIFRNIAILVGAGLILALGGIIISLYVDKLVALVTYVLGGICLLFAIALIIFGIITSKKTENEIRSQEVKEDKEDNV